MRTKREAQAAAAKLLKMLKGKGWKTRVWENLGWHYECRLNGLTVMPSYGGFYCLLDTEKNPPTGGQMFWTENENDTFKDPNKAVARQLKVARDFVSKVDDCVSTLEKATA